MDNTVRINAYWEPRYQRVGLYAMRSDGELGHKAEPIIWTPKKDRFEYVEPCMTFDDPKELQELMDSMWCMGLRPSARSDEYKAQLGTMKDHLNDMRALVFKDKREDLE